MDRATAFMSSSGAVSECATNCVMSSVAIIEKTVMKRSSVAVRIAIIISPVVMRTAMTTSAPSLVLIENGLTPPQGSLALLR